MIKLKISVTEEILNGDCVAQNGSNCAIAKAVKQIFPFAHVQYDFIRPFTYMRTEWCNKVAYRIFLPKEAKKFIEEFDSGHSVAPISFEVEIPDSVIEQINIEEIRPLLQNHPSLELIES